MARATHVKKARKDIPGTDIKAGDSYYWWKFMVGGRGGPKHYSKERPRLSQLTQSEYLGALYDLQDRLSALPADSSLADEVQSLVDDIRQLGEDQTDKLNNMPDSLQQSSTGEMLQERADAMESAASELDGLDMSEYDKEGHGEDYETEEEYWQAKLEEIHNSISLEG